MDALSPFVSVLPGRIRLRHPLLRDRKRHAALAARLEPLGTVQGNSAVGSFLICFDPARPELDAAIRAEVAALLPQPAAEPATVRRQVPHVGKRIALPRPRKTPAKWELNRAAKIGAVVSMAVSLAALGTSKKLHAQAGFVFVAMMLAHMAVHWRRTFK